MSQLDELIQSNTNDVLKAFGLQNLSYGRWPFEAMCWWPARHWGKRLLAYDRRVGQAGLRAGAEFLLPYFAAGAVVTGSEYINAEGPLVILSNHPGLADVMALCANIPRPDLRIVAIQRPLLQALPQTEDFLIYMDEDQSDKYQSMRNIIKHLKRGGALLTFPAAQIEPDPAWSAGAKLSLENWTENITQLSQLNPSPLFVPALVSGVLSPRAQRHPLTKVRRRQADREWLGAILQILWPPYRRMPVSLNFGPPIPGQMLRNQGNAKARLTLIQEQMALLIDQVER